MFDDVIQGHVTICCRLFILSYDGAKFPTCVYKTRYKSSLIKRHIVHSQPAGMRTNHKQKRSSPIHGPSAS